MLHQWLWREPVPHHREGAIKGQVGGNGGGGTGSVVSLRILDLSSDWAMPPVPTDLTATRPIHMQLGEVRAE